MIIRNACFADLDQIAQLEHLNFGSEIAMTREAFEERLQLTSDTFLVVEHDQKVIAYIEGPVVSQPVLTDDLFHQVTPNASCGGYIAITSLSVSPDYKGQGLGTTLLAAMKDLALAQGRLGLILTCEDYLVPYYRMNGFTDEGQAQSQHGGRIWYQMRWQSPSEVD